MKIVFIGDSITSGYALRKNDIWTNIINNKTNYEIINKGIIGDTTGGMLARFTRDVIYEKPDIVHIMGGSNDIICSNSNENVKSNIMAMAHQALANNIKPIIGISPTIMIDDIIDEWQNFTNFSEVEKQVIELNKWIKKFTNTFRADLIDYKVELKSMLDEDLTNIYIDGIHLNTKGNELLAEIFIKHISK